MKTTLLLRIAAVMTLAATAGCANNQSAQVWRASKTQPAPQKESSSIPEEEFNPITQDYESRPPFGSRGIYTEN